MPKRTFFNLPEHKKDHLLHAAKEEFSRVPLNEASIANIVKTAEIPRGSFYQYFEDKEDVFYYLLMKHAEEKRKEFAVIMNQNKGDLFATIIDAFEIIIKDEVNYKFLKNTFLHLTHKTESIFAKSFHDYGLDKPFDQMSVLIDQSNLNVEDEKELFHLFRMVTTITFQNIVDKFALDLPIEQALENFKIEMRLLQRGLLKTDHV